MNILFGFIMLFPSSRQEFCPIDDAKVAQNARYAKTLATNGAIIHPSPVSKKRSNNRIYKMTENKNGRYRPPWHRYLPNQTSLQPFLSLKPQQRLQIIYCTSTAKPTQRNELYMNKLTMP